MRRISGTWLALLAGCADDASVGKAPRCLNALAWSCAARRFTMTITCTRTCRRTCTCNLSVFPRSIFNLTTENERTRTTDLNHSPNLTLVTALPPIYTKT